MSLAARLSTGCLILVTLAVFAAVTVGYGVYRFSDTGTVRGGWSEPLGAARSVRASVDVDHGDVAIADSLPAGEQLPADRAIQTEYRVGADSPIARSWEIANGMGLADLGSEPANPPVAALRWLRSPEEATWDVGLNPTVPLELDVNVAVGSARLDMTGLTTDRFSVNVGVGEADVVIGDAGMGAEASSIRIGVGDVRLAVPEDVPVRIQVTAGLSEIPDPEGFVFDGTHYTNSAWRELADPAAGLDIVVETGTGSVSLSALVPATPSPVEGTPGGGAGRAPTRSPTSLVPSLPARSPVSPD